jgi:hypothetical protein
MQTLIPFLDALEGIEEEEFEDSSDDEWKSQLYLLLHCYSLLLCC